MGRNRSASRKRDTDRDNARPPVLRATRWRSWAITAALWAFVSIGAIGGVVGLTRPQVNSVTDGLGGELTDVVPPPEVLGMAEWAVRTALPAADVQAIGADVAAPGERERSSGGTVRILSATAVAADPIDDDYWAITVAAEIELGPGQVVRWYLEVGVIDDPSGAYVATDPALVPAPSAPEHQVEPEGTLRTPDPSDSSVATVASFLRALLSGDPAVGRWTAPDVTIGPAVAPDTFVDVRVSRAAIAEVDAGIRRVRVEIVATTATDSTVALAYEVTLAIRGDRWEVTAMSGAPTLTASGSRGGTQSTSTSPTRPTATPSTSTSTAPTTSTTAALAPDDGATNPYLYEEEEH